MALRLVFLGRLEELAGRAFEDMAPTAPLDWNDLLGWLGGCYSSQLADSIDGHRVKIAVNGALVADKSAIVLVDGDEIAFLPPVSGG